MKLHLIVKGTGAEAHNAATWRDIPFVFNRMVRVNETSGFVDPAHTDKVAKWYGEPPTKMVDADEYAPGTLLIYSEIGEGASNTQEEKRTTKT